MHRIIIWLLVLASLTSCNVFAPFEPSGSEAAILEEALKCLHAGDYDCAIAEYDKLGAGAAKSRQLCTTYLSKAGISLSVLINTVTQSSNMLGQLANQLLPWTAAKQADAKSAQTHCAAYANLVGNQGAGLLLNALGVYTDCAMRMAKSDQFIDTNSSSDCSTANTSTNDGSITRSDISSTGDGQLTAGGSRGMCTADVDICSNNFSTISSANFAASGLSNINNAPSGVAGAATVAARLSLHNDLPS